MLTQDEYTVTKQGTGFTVGTLDTQHRKLGYLKKSTLVGQFDGVGTFLDFVATEMPEARRGKSSLRGEGGSFNAFPSYDVAIDTFRTKPESIVEFDPSELRIKDESEAGSQVEYDVTGDYIDMGRHMEGIPESVGTMHNGNARNRRVNIVLNLNQIWSVRHEDITHRGERILRLVDALEAGGVRTQLTGILSNQCAHVEVVLKQHEEPLTISDLAVVNHPEFLRRILFRFKEHSATWDYGYGTATLFSKALTPELIDNGTNDEIDIAIDSNMRGISEIDQLFDKAERLLVWEMSKPVPEVSSIKLDASGIYFQANGTRSEQEIQREGREVINAI